MADDGWWLVSHPLRLKLRPQLETWLEPRSGESNGFTGFESALFTLSCGVEDGFRNQNFLPVENQNFEVKHGEPNFLETQGTRVGSNLSVVRLLVHVIVAGPSCSG